MFKIVALIGLLLSFFSISFGQVIPYENQNIDVVIQQLNDHLHPLKSPLPESSFADLSPLEGAGNSRIVGLGEATHGSREFFQLKHKIFRYLVEQHNFRVFAFEADMGESFYINRYIQGSPGDISDIMKTKMHFWTWKTEEVKALLEWMRIYNAGKPTSEKIHYIGVDSQYMTYQPGLIKDYIKATKPVLLDETRSVLEIFTKLTNLSRKQISKLYREMSEERKEGISDSLDQLKRMMTEMKTDMISITSEYEFYTIYQMVRNLQQVHLHLYALEKLGNRWLRDRFMAENALWTSQLFGENTKIALWAHNGHISETKDLYKSMGYHLDKELGNDYKTIAFTFSKGTFTARGVDLFTNKPTGLGPKKIYTSPMTGSINSLFHSAQMKNFILNLDTLATNSALRNWFTSKRNLLQIGAIFNGIPKYYYRPTVLTEDYDFIIHIDSTSYALSVN